MPSAEATQAEVYTLYYNKVFGYVLNRVHSRADAEDITSDVFLKIYSKEQDFDLQKPGASTYIYKVMQTTLADHFRQNRVVYMPLDEVGDLPEEEDGDDLLSALNDALDTLPEREMAVVIMHYYHGLSHKEIADKMGLSYANVRQLCHVALKKLRSHMQS